MLQVNVINFTVTRSGLEEQLLSDVVSKEKPDIENRKNRLLISMAADKKQLRVSVATPPLRTRVLNRCFGFEDDLPHAVSLRAKVRCKYRALDMCVACGGPLVCSLCLQDIEDKVLKLLSESKGLIVDDEELIAALAGSCSACMHAMRCLHPAVRCRSLLYRCCHTAFGKL